MTLVVEPALELLPALDVQGGSAVRLTQGDIDSGNHGDPADVARELVEAGARWIHLVDLDQAFGTGDNQSLLAEVCRLAVDEGARVQWSGGVLSAGQVARGLEAGAERVNVSCAALDELDLLASLFADFGESVCLSLDVRDGVVAPRGVKDPDGSPHVVRYQGRPLDAPTAVGLLTDLGARRLVVTDVEADGAMSGPGWALLDRLVDLTDIPLVVSGGVATLDDIAQLRSWVPRGIEGAVVGKALYSGAFTLPAALDVAGDPQAP